MTRHQRIIATWPWHLSSSGRRLLDTFLRRNFQTCNITYLGCESPEEAELKRESKAKLPARLVINMPFGSHGNQVSSVDAIAPTLWWISLIGLLLNVES